MLVNSMPWRCWRRPPWKVSHSSCLEWWLGPPSLQAAHWLSHASLTWLDHFFYSPWSCSDQDGERHPCRCQTSLYCPPGIWYAVCVSIWLMNIFPTFNLKFPKTHIFVLPWPVVVVWIIKTSKKHRRVWKKCWFILFYLFHFSFSDRGQALPGVGISQRWRFIHQIIKRG